MHLSALKEKFFSHKRNGQTPDPELRTYGTSTRRRTLSLSF